MTTSAPVAPSSSLLAALSLDRLLPIALMAIVFFAAMLSVTPWPVGAFQDDAVYTLLAKSLATGEGYRMINLPGSPHATHYPPGYPAFLAVLWRLAPSFPDNIVVFKFANAGWLALDRVDPFIDQTVVHRVGHKTCPVESAGSLPGGDPHRSARLEEKIIDPEVAQSVFRIVQDPLGAIRLRAPSIGGEVLPRAAVEPAQPAAVGADPSGPLRIESNRDDHVRQEPRFRIVDLMRLAPPIESDQAVRRPDPNLVPLDRQRPDHHLADLPAGPEGGRFGGGKGLPPADPGGQEEKGRGKK